MSRYRVEEYYELSQVIYKLMNNERLNLDERHVCVIGLNALRNVMRQIDYEDDSIKHTAKEIMNILYGGEKT